MGGWGGGGGGGWGDPLEKVLLTETEDQEMGLPAKEPETHAHNLSLASKISAQFDQHSSRGLAWSAPLRSRRTLAGRLPAP